MTPAQKAGLVIGEEYIVTEDTTFKKGSTVIFVEDDGSTTPRFKGSQPAEKWLEDAQKERGFLYVGVDSVKKAEPSFKVGDVVKSKGYTDSGIDTVTSYTVTYVGSYYGSGSPYIGFIDNDGDIRNRPVCEYTLVAAADSVSSVASVPVSIDVTADLTPAFTMERVGETVTLSIMGKLTKEQVAAVLNTVFDN